MDDNFFWLCVAALATWRITSILYREKIATPIRRWFGERNDVHTGMESYPDTFFGKLFSCYWCLSVWVGITVTFIWYGNPYFLLPFALSALAILIDQKVE